jgi:hypothetical protein
MGLLHRRAPRAGLPPAVIAALALAKGERVLAFGVDDNTGRHVVATTFALAVVAKPLATPATQPAVVTQPVVRQSVVTEPVVPDPVVTPAAVQPAAECILRRRWLSVDAGAWEPDTATLTVTWADGGRGAQWSFRGQKTRLPETLRERVQASVVIATRLTLGDRRNGRVAIRQDFATRELIPQTILGRNTRADDPEVQAHVQAALAHLRDQVGLPA